MFYEDLSPYRCIPIPTGLPGVCNVGWLSSSVPSHGDVQASLLAKLEHFARTPVLLTRGHHVCGMCGVTTGNGEVWVPGRDGHVYASPAMLPHYLSAHGYVPPSAYLEALDGAIAPLTDSECCARIVAQRRKLDESPTASDILVPYYSVKVFWATEHFDDLTEFDVFISTWFPARFHSIALGERGYFVRTECEDPAGLLQELAAGVKASGRAPVCCASKLVYIGEKEELYFL